MAELEIIDTEDGSHTIYHRTLQETYHSKNGAILESQHVYIDAGLIPCLERLKKVKILELGFGTGLNAGLTWKWLQKHIGLSTELTTLEAYPVPDEIIEKMNYPDQLDMSNFGKLHHAPWERMHKMSSNFTLCKIRTDFSAYSYEESFDLIYFDVFAPQYQSIFWEEPFLSKLLHNFPSGSVLVTYGAKGSFRRALRNLGMEVEKLPGPPGKREMTRATKI